MKPASAHGHPGKFQARPELWTQDSCLDKGMKEGFLNSLQPKKNEGRVASIKGQ